MARNAKPTPLRKAAPKRVAKASAITEHRVAVASVGVAVTFGRGRSEVFELRGTASVNASVADELVRTTGFVALIAGKGTNTVACMPASLSRNLVLTLHVDGSDLALLRAVFVTGTGSELSDPALTVWATTARPLKPDVAGSEAVLEFGYRLDFDPPPLGAR